MFHQRVTNASRVMDPLLCTVTLQVSTFCLLQRKQQAGNVQHRGAISEERQVKLVERAFARFAFIFPHTHAHSPLFIACHPLFSFSFFFFTQTYFLPSTVYTTCTYKHHFIHAFCQFFSIGCLKEAGFSFSRYQYS